MELEQLRQTTAYVDSVVQAAQNERAQRFYAKSGFERVGTKRFLFGGVYEDDYVMERPVPPLP